MVENFGRTIITGAISIVASIVVLGSLLYFLSGRVGGEAVKIVSDRGIIHKNSQLIEGLASIKANAPEIGKYAQALGVLLPAEDELVNFSTWLDGLSRARQVSESFSFQGKVVESSQSEAGYAGFSLDASGAYDNLVNFLKDVESKAPRYLVAFDSFDLKRGTGGYRALIRGRIFFR